LDDNKYKYYNPSCLEDEQFDYELNPFHINYEINVFNKYYGPSCIRITFDNVDSDKLNEYNNDNNSKSDKSDNDDEIETNILIENCIIESPQGFGI